MTEFGLLIGLSHSLLALTYVCGVLMQTLPVPRPSWKAWGPTLMWDALIGELALASLSAVQLAVNGLSNVLGTTFVGPFSSSSLSFGLIIGQLVAIDSAIFLLTSAISATVVLAPVAELLARMLGPAASWVTGAIILWSALVLIAGLFPKIWVSVYALGVCLFAIPFRLGRQAATYFMASSIVLAIGLPPMPYMALWLEGYIGYQGFLKPIQDAAAQVQTNPLMITQLMNTLPSALGNLIAAVVIALIVFPIVYLFILTAITRSLAKVIGGSAGGPMITKFVLTT